MTFFLIPDLLVFKSLVGGTAGEEVSGQEGPRANSTGEMVKEAPKTEVSGGQWSTVCARRSKGLKSSKSSWFV